METCKKGVEGFEGLGRETGHKSYVLPFLSDSINSQRLLAPPTLPFQSLVSSLFSTSGCKFWEGGLDAVWRILFKCSELNGWDGSSSNLEIGCILVLLSRRVTDKKMYILFPFESLFFSLGLPFPLDNSLFFFEPYRIIRH